MDYKKNIQLCVDALTVNDNKAVGQMRDGSGGRCCLCVMEDTLKKEYPDMYDAEAETNHHFPDTVIFRDLLGFSFDHSVTIDGRRETLSTHNDGYKTCHRKTHVQIAEALELEFLK